MSALLTAERARELFEYEPETGLLWWKPRRTITGRLLFLGLRKLAGCTNTDGYRVVRVDRRLYYVHRVAFLIVTGEWPPEHVDHENGKKADNRWKKLRPATLTENNRNGPVRRNNSLGLKGVYLATDGGAYQASITVDRKDIYLGRFHTADEAHAAYCAAADQCHGAFANHGRKE